MEELKEKFDGTGEVKNVKFELIQRSKNAYLYKGVDSITKHVRYEVFKRVESEENEAMIDGVLVKYAPKVRYPKSKDFGKWAWCMNSYGKAILKFNEIK